MPVDLVVLEVPTSARAHHAGQELTPGTLRSHGFVDGLRRRREAVSDAGDVAGRYSDTVLTAVGGAIAQQC